MKNEKNLGVLSVVAICIVVAIVASLITVGITGNTISVARGAAGEVYTTSETYSKASVDTLFNALKIGLGNVYNKAQVTAMIKGIYSSTYTKAEVDAKVNELSQKVETIETGLETGVTNIMALKMFRDKCILTNPDLFGFNGTYKISDVCVAYNAQWSKSTSCVLADELSSGGISTLLTCNGELQAQTNRVHVMCCDPSTATICTTSNNTKINKNEKVTLEYKEKKYVISINYLDSSTTILNVDNVLTNKLEVGGYYKFPDSTLLIVNKIAYQTYAGGGEAVYVTFTDC